MNSNNKNVLIVLAGGFVIALVVALLVQAALGGGEKVEEIDTDRIEILVASKDLTVGHEIEQGDLRWQVWPTDSMFPGAIMRDEEQTALEAANGKLLRSLTEGQPVHMNVMVEDNQGEFLSANVEKGMRAVGISVRAHVLADRLIRPGDYVDVLMTYQVRVNSRSNPDVQDIVNRYATETVIENVRVLAIDKEDTKAVDALEDDDKKKKSNKTKSKATLTLEVKPKQAEYLLLATEMGEIGLALRSYGDNEMVTGNKTSTDVKVSNVLTTLSAMRESSSAVRVYNGDQLIEVEARNVDPQNGVSFDVQQPRNEEATINNTQTPAQPAGAANDDE